MWSPSRSDQQRCSVYVIDASRSGCEDTHMLLISKLLCVRA